MGQTSPACQCCSSLQVLPRANTDTLVRLDTYHRNPSQCFAASHGAGDMRLIGLDNFTGDKILDWLTSLAEHPQLADKMVRVISAF